MQVFTQQPVEKQDGMRHALTQDGRRLLKAAKNCYVTWIASECAPIKMLAHQNLVRERACQNVFMWLH